MHRKSWLSLGLFLALASPAHAADWLVVARDKVRRVELDRSTVMPSDQGARVAWGRIVLSDEEATRSGFATLRVLNRYDCRRAAFTMVKRVYLSADERTLREERVDAAQAAPVRRGTVDERFYQEVCRPPQAGTLRDIALEAAARAEVAGRSSAR